MTSGEEMSSRRRTAAAMHGTAEQLEVAEAILHRSAEESPNPATTARLHALGDEVTAQAHAIDRRADSLTLPGLKHEGAWEHEGTWEHDADSRRDVNGKSIAAE
ncbi:hypothetical protein [Actinoplanes sp. GCM10030250]|uniref:hypothetical protein n=1 Tax=Actinoplanes sp. GCM10030250 TaxID=3273376 RepID=UPI00361820B2